MTQYISLNANVNFTNAFTNDSDLENWIYSYWWLCFQAFAGVCWKASGSNPMHSFSFLSFSADTGWYMQAIAIKSKEGWNAEVAHSLPDQSWRRDDKQKEINLFWQTTSYGHYNHHYQTHWNLARLEKQPSKERESVKNKNTHERGNWLLCKDFGKA